MVEREANFASSTTELSQTFIVSLLVAGEVGFSKLPPTFRATALPVPSHQRIFKLIESVRDERGVLDLTTVAKTAGSKIREEIVWLVANVPHTSYFVDGQLEQAAHELIRRAECVNEVKPGQVDTDSEVGIGKSTDTSQFRPMSSDELVEILGLTIKKDEQNKLITFLCELSAYTEDSQLNISFNAPSSTGKSYIPLEIARLFPREDVIEIGYCSPTAFFHEVGTYRKDKKGYIVDLSRKILIFLDQPHTLLLQRLRPLLSHDKKEIRLKITDKSQKAGLRTKNIFLRGFPSVIFCTAGLKIDEQEATRFLLLSPETNQEKIRQAIHERIMKESDGVAYQLWLEENSERKLLKERIWAIKQENIRDIRIGSPAKVKEEFFRKNAVLKPRHQRDIGRIISLIKAFALTEQEISRAAADLLLLLHETLSNELYEKLTSGIYSQSEFEQHQIKLAEWARLSQELTTILN